MKNQRKYYARQWYIGRGVTTGNYPHIRDACDYFAFNSKDERTNWLDHGNDYAEFQKDYRESIPASDRGLKKALYISEYSNETIDIDPETNQITKY